MKIKIAKWQIFDQLKRFQQEDLKLILQERFCRLINRVIESPVLAKSIFLIVFHNNEEEDNIDFVDHINVYKEVYCLCTSVQPHSIDCLLVLLIGGEWLLLQWNKT
ncbi:MAG: hypothetical protein EZS28_003906 [Streblomastix strix]|uniref:Uncharacterized protein n=1 Tax=Streblomastix strix TaxID=222440 RepID=A0A5J4X275_9EUKA|nr:MAG: hypothetical protein EZS28_003906 [Streblomastix strix]